MLADCLVHLGRQRQRFQFPAQVGRFLAQEGRIVDVEGDNPVKQRSRVAYELAVGAGGDDESGRYRETFLAEQGEVGPLAAGQVALTGQRVGEGESETRLKRHAGILSRANWRSASQSARAARAKPNRTSIR